MSIDTETPFYKRLWFGVGLIAIILILITIIIGYIAINHFEKKRDIETTQIISEILNQASKARQLLPDVLVINVSDKEKQLVLESIRKDVSKLLIERYTNRSDEISQIELHPYVSFLEKANNKPITVEQVDELKKDIQFLVSTCEKAIEDSKRNIDTEMSKINTWVTIWIGVFGLLAIFIPIMVNLKSFDSLKEIEKKATAADNKLNKHKEDIESIAGLKTDVVSAAKELATIKETLPDLTTRSETALLNSESAITQSVLNNRIMIALSAIGKLKKLERVVYLNRENPMPIIRTNLSSILNIFRTINDNHDANFYSELLEELKERLSELASMTLIRNRHHTIALSTFAVYINNKIARSSPLTNLDHNDIIENFETMLAAINQ